MQIRGSELGSVGLAETQVLFVWPYQSTQDQFDSGTFRTVTVSVNRGHIKLLLSEGVLLSILPELDCFI